MDKWDEMAERLTKAVLANEPGAILVATLQYFGEFGRVLELISQDTDRFATAAERLVQVAEKTAALPEPEKVGE